MPANTFSIRRITDHFRGYRKDDILLHGAIMVGLTSLMLLIGGSLRPDAGPDSGNRPLPDALESALNEAD